MGVRPAPHGKQNSAPWGYSPTIHEVGSAFTFYLMVSSGPYLFGSRAIFNALLVESSSSLQRWVGIRRRWDFRKIAAATRIQDHR